MKLEDVSPLEVEMTVQNATPAASSGEEIDPRTKNILWRGILMPDGRTFDWSGENLPDEAMEVFTKAALSWEGKELARGNLVVFFHKVSQRVILQVRGGKLHDKDTSYTTGPLLRFLRFQ
jgi:hypothetical protein